MFYSLGIFWQWNSQAWFKSILEFPLNYLSYKTSYIHGPLSLKIIYLPQLKRV